MCIRDRSEIVDTMVNDALWDATGFYKHMGMSAENVCTNETYQKKYGYSPCLLYTSPARSPAGRLHRKCA